MFRQSSSANFVLVIVLLGICIASGDARAPARLIGGSDAEPGEFPWQVSLRIYDSHLCGGIIISKRHILTAAHCIVGIVQAPYSELTVVTGSNTLKPGTGTSFRVKDIITHNDYVPRTKRVPIKNDIAVISLRKEIVVNDFQKPIPLPTEDVPSAVEGIVSGFGRTSFPKGEPSSVLQKFIVIILSSVDCFEQGVYVQQTQICAFKGFGFGTCKGDSGGPLVYNGTVVGITSTSEPCGIGYPDTFTRVYEYLDFINDSMDSI